MSIEENKAAVRRFVEMLDTNDLAALHEVLSPELAEAWSNGINLDWITDHRVSITDIVAEGDKVAVMLASSGIHTGEWEGIPATGIAWTNQGATFFYLENGKIVGHDIIFDDMPILKQIGATVTPPALART